MCGSLEDRDDLPPPPRRPDLWRDSERSASGEDAEQSTGRGAGEAERTEVAAADGAHRAGRQDAHG